MTRFTSTKNSLHNITFLAFCFAVFISTNLEAQYGLTDTKKSTLDMYIQDVHEQIGMPGIAFAVLKHGELIYKSVTGFANLEHEVAVSEKTVFPLYSLTKPFIAVGMFQLIEAGELSLNDTVEKYVTGIPDAWKKVQIKHLLSHASGLPDMAGKNPYEIRDYTEEQAKERVLAMPLEFERGEKYAYNQTNFWLLKLIIEKLSGQSLSDFIVQGQFANAPEGSVLFSADAREIIKHRATAYFPWVKGKLMIDLPYANGDYFLACNGMHITMDAFIDWDKRLKNNELISKETREQMWTLFEYKYSEKTFAYGWEATELEGMQAFGFSGAMATFYRTYPSENLSVIFLSNGFASMYNQDALANALVGLLLD